jgi:DNA-binding MarR family transcriptional regulator
MLLWRVTNRWQAAQRAALKPFGLTHVQFVLLASLTYLTYLNGPSDPSDPNDGDDAGPVPLVTQRLLADHAATDEMMTSQVLRTLEGKGLLSRHRHPVDGRAWVLSVTPAGNELANRAVVTVEACDRGYFAAIGDQVPGFTDALGRLWRGSEPVL